MKRVKNVSYLWLLAIATAFVVSGCSSDDDSDNDEEEIINNGDDTNSGVTTDGDVTTFDVALDTTSLDETVQVDASDEDYIENSTFADTIYVNFASSGATVTGNDDGYVTASVTDNDVVITNNSSNNICYVLSGSTSDGFFKLYSSKKQAIMLNGVSITNPDGAAINNQSSKRTFIVLASDKSNYLTDGTSYSDATDDEDMKATLFSEGQLIFSGDGYLQVDANCKAGIRSDDYVRIMPLTNIYVDASAGNGIRGNDAVTVTGGVVNVNITGTACKGLSSDGEILIEGGRTTVLTSGGYEWDDDDEDYSACAGLKADSVVNVTAGELYLKSSGIGGKGISSDGDINISDGTVKIITTGTGYESGDYSTSPKGIKADGNVNISGGQIQVRCSNSEGIESKALMNISSGLVEVYSYDDGLNSTSDLTISGGYVYIHTTNNDAVDANGNLYINGGTVIAEGASGAECGLDAAEGYSIYINGGTVVSLGGSLGEVSSSSQQASVTASVSSGQTIALLSGTTCLLGYTVPSGNSTALMISCPSLSSGSTYTLLKGCTLSGGTAFYSLTTGCTASGGSSTSLTASTSVGNSMGGGMFR
ncbi:MAG: carbohydrate-binding domain-containing protein [Prevotella sp.]